VQINGHNTFIRSLDGFSIECPCRKQDTDCVTSPTNDCLICISHIGGLAVVMLSTLHHKASLLQRITTPSETRALPLGRCLLAPTLLVSLSRTRIPSSGGKSTWRRTRGVNKLARASLHKLLCEVSECILETSVSCLCADLTIISVKS